MKNNKMSDFLIDSKYHCFFCLDKTSPPLTNIGDDQFVTELTTVHSLQYLSRFLRMDMKKVFTEKGDTSPDLLAKVEMSRLKAHLCERCANLNESFSSICRRMEQVELELLSSLREIYDGLVEAEGTDQYQKLRNPLDDSGDEWMGKLGILEILRKEAIQKCSIKFQNSRPRVVLENSSTRGITKIMQKYNLNSGRKRSARHFTTDYVKEHTDVIGIKIEQGETLPDPNFSDPDMDNQSDFEFDRESPTTPPESKEQVVKRENNESVSSRKPGSRRPKQRGMLDPKINKHLERIISNGKMKFRCKLCGKGFPQSQNARVHIRTVHLKEKSHQCPQCSKAFTQKVSLQTHMRLHSGIKPYKCHLCPKEFFQIAHLRRHLIIHGGKRPYKCNICQAAYFERYELTSHLRLKH